MEFSILSRNNWDFLSQNKRLSDILNPFNLVSKVCMKNMACMYYMAVSMFSIVK